MTPNFAFIEGLMQPGHLLILAVIGILVFGKRLPEVGRSLGKGIVEFKKGLKGVEDEIDGGSGMVRQEPTAALQPPPRPPQRVAPTAPKFQDDAGIISTPPNPPSA
jgi:sec-independent protein translocase protein TatA